MSVNNICFGLFWARGCFVLNCIRNSEKTYFTEIVLEWNLRRLYSCFLYNTVWLITSCCALPLYKQAFQSGWWLTPTGALVPRYPMTVPFWIRSSCSKEDNTLLNFSPALIKGVLTHFNYSVKLIANFFLLELINQFEDKKDWSVSIFANIVWFLWVVDKMRHFRTSSWTFAKTTVHHFLTFYRPSL